MGEMDPTSMGAAVYPLLNSIVVPRPIAWVSTRSAEGVTNLAPHSYFTVASVAPPVVSFTSIGTKDSLRNIRASGEFVVHVVSRALAETANGTGTDFPADLSEYEALDLATVPAHSVAPPRLAAAGVALECRSAGERCFGDSTVVFGEVVWIGVDDALLAADGYVDLRALAPVSRLGRNDWAEVGEVFALRRQPYGEWARAQRS